MTYHYEKPTRVWLLSVDAPPRRLTDEELEGFFIRYEDTGWEPALGSLYKLMGCDIVERRTFREPRGECWMDEEGSFRDKPIVNPVATLLYSGEYEAGAQGHPILGDCVFIVYGSCPKGRDEEILMRGWHLFVSKFDVPYYAERAT